MRRLSSFILVMALSFFGFSQDELLDLLANESSKGKNYAIATFKSTRLINGQSVEVRSTGVLEFIIGHRFGTINSGVDEFWGLDISSVRLGLEYGITDNFNIGIGRASLGKVLDGYMKYRLIRQSNSFPITATAFTSVARKTVDELGLEDGVNRMAYTGQLLMARKISSKLSLQVMPTVIQRNLVLTLEDDNLLVAIGVGGRYKVSNRIAINTEYYPQVTDYSSTFTNAFAIGVDIETGGHVFQLHFTNAQQMNERGFIGETQEDFLDGGIHYGFNISRVFDLTPKK